MAGSPRGGGGHAGSHRCSRRCVAGPTGDATLLLSFFFLSFGYVLF